MRPSFYLDGCTSFSADFFPSTICLSPAAGGIHLQCELDSSKACQCLPFPLEQSRGHNRFLQASDLVNSALWTPSPVLPSLTLPQSFSLLSSHSDLYGSLLWNLLPSNYSWLLSHLFKCPIFITFLQNSCSLLLSVLFNLFSVSPRHDLPSDVLYVYLSICLLMVSSLLPPRFHQTVTVFLHYCVSIPST